MRKEIWKKRKIIKKNEIRKSNVYVDSESELRHRCAFIRELPTMSRYLYIH